MTNRSPAQRIADLLRAGASVVVYHEADELLAVAEAQAGAAACEPVRTMSAADPEAATAVEELATGTGTLILCDFLSIYGENPMSARLVRQVALQQRDGTDYARLILIERPDTKVPAAIAGDVEVLSPELPTVAELGDELDTFLADNPTVMPEGNGETRYAIAGAVAGLARHEAARLFARCVIDTGGLDVAWLRREKAQRIAVKLGGALTFADPEAAAVGGLDNLRDWLRIRKRAFASAAARAFGLPEPKGILIVGVPGGGKTLTAKAVAREWELPLLVGNIGKLFGSLVGQTEANVEAFIQAVEASAPVVLLVDEFEKLTAGMTGKGQSSDGGTTQRAGGRLLSWLNDKTKPVFVIATANRVEQIGPEMLRKGRFDEIFAVGLPSVEERTEIMRIHVERRDRQFAATDYAALAETCEGFTGAEIEQVVIDGLYAAFNADRDLTIDDVRAAIKSTTPLSKTAPQDIKAIEAWAEGRARPASKSTTTTTARRRGPKLEVN